MLKSFPARCLAFQFCFLVLLFRSSFCLSGRFALQDFVLWNFRILHYCRTLQAASLLPCFRNFQGCITVHLSRFCCFCLLLLRCNSDILSQVLFVVNTFFQLFSFCFAVQSTNLNLKASISQRSTLYHNLPYFVNIFFYFFSWLEAVCSALNESLFIVSELPENVNTYFQKNFVFSLFVFSLLFNTKRNGNMTFPMFPFLPTSETEKEGFEPSRRLPDLHP